MTNLPNWNINKSWTLFLDRDGVINVRFPGDYVKHVGEFEFISGAIEAIAGFSELFGRIIVVTNQQGIARGFYTHEDLGSIHTHMQAEIEKAGGKIDRVYYAHQAASENSPMRKPGTGMALQAQKDFSEIDFSKSVMMGDTQSDMEFGKALGMKTIFVGDEKLEIEVDGKVNAIEDAVFKQGNA
ncbi:MAG: HAD family hydrolase [Bacteroidota bacterium]|nr:HAD family hydrolase [Bacteroidota bacterium]